MRGTLLFTQEDGVAQTPGTIRGFKLTWDSAAAGGFGIAVYRNTAAGVETFWQECADLAAVTTFLSTYNVTLSTRIRNLLTNRG